MKRDSYLLRALLLALPLSLGVTSAWAEEGDEEGTTTVSITDFSQGTATRSDNSNPEPGGNAFITWVSTATPAVTVQDAGSTTNNIEFSSNGDDTYALKLSEGSSTAFGYTISIADGYYITSLTIGGSISATGLKVTVDYDNELSVEEANGTVSKTIENVNKPLVRLHLDGDAGSETFTITSLSITYAEGIPDPVDLTGLKVKAVSSDVASSIEEGKWYVLASAGSKAANNVAYEDEGYISLDTDVTISDHVYQGQTAEDAAKYLLRFIPSSKQSAGSDGNETPVYHPQWATGNYWNDMKDNGSTSDSSGDITVSTTSIGEWNVYQANGYTYYGFNVYDLGNSVNISDESTKRLKQWSNTGYVQDGNTNDHWNIYEVTLAEDVDEEEGEDDTVDLDGLYVTEVATDVAESVEADKWYVLSSASTNDCGGKFVYYDAEASDDDHSTPFTEGTTLSDYVSKGKAAEDVANYLIRFISSDKTSNGYTDDDGETHETPVYNVQFATGGYWSDASGSDSEKILVSTTSKGDYNVYKVSGQTYFGMNVYDLGHTVNVVSTTYALKTNSANTGYVTSDHPNDHWNLYEVTLGTSNEEGDDNNSDEEGNEEEEQEDIDGTLDIDGLYVTEVSDEPTTEISEDTWYLLIHDGGFPDELAYDTQDGNIKAVHYTDTDDDSKSLSDYVYVGQEVEKAAPYLMRYIASSATVQDETSPVYYIQWATDNWWADMTSSSQSSNITTSDYDGKGRYNAYALGGETQLIGMNVYDLGLTVNLSAVNGNLILNNSGKIPSDSQANDHWYLYEVKLGALSEETEVTWKMTTAQWGTLILPFAADVPDDLAVYTVEGISDEDELSLTATESIASCTPYVVEYKGEEGIEEAKEYTFKGKRENEQDTYTATASDGTSLTGTLSDMTMPESTDETSYYLLQEQDTTVAFYIVQDEGRTLSAYHCYLSLPVSTTVTDEGSVETDVKLLVGLPSSQQGGVETAVSAVRQGEASAQTVYDLSGRQVSQPRKGIYVKGGRKVIIK
ncbi:MAG: hypothetical protein LUI09_08475 [Prevotellaceae bacterium]|nr:hypothetical protein [Prevotellaceae bacterium]